MEKVLWPWYCSHGEVPSHLYVRVCWMVRKDNWIKSYFDAILDIGKSADGDRPSLLLLNHAHFSLAAYSVEEIIIDAQIPAFWISLFFFQFDYACSESLSVFLFLFFGD